MQKQICMVEDNVGVSRGFLQPQNIHVCHAKTISSTALDYQANLHPKH